MAPHADDSSAPSTHTESSSSSASSLSSLSSYHGYDHVHWYVGNAKQAVTYYISRMGFRLLAYRDLSTGSRAIASYAIRNGAVTFVLTSPLRSADRAETPQDAALLASIAAHLERHGDAVKDVAFVVDSVDSVYDAAVANGGKSVSAPETVRDDDGSIRRATVQTYGETTHTLISRRDYKGVFLPGYKAASETADPLNMLLPKVTLEAVDHCVGNQDWDEMNDICE
jgi:4-hydroxyphenylpyruvate dioxygenase